MTTLPCAHCGADLEPAVPEDVNQPPVNQPHGGTAFHTDGHYGSTVFDPMDGTSLELNICDPCLVAMGRAGKVLHHAPYPATARTTTAWMPGNAVRITRGWAPGPPIYFAPPHAGKVDE